MPDERVIEQVGGILSMNEVKFMTHENKQSFLIGSGSANVIVDFFDWGESTVIALHSTVLAQIDSSGDRKHKILETLNDKNQSIPFGRFHFDEPAATIVLDYHLLGDNLQAPELMNGIGVLLSMADELDDELSKVIGSGTRALDVWNAAEGEAGEGAGTGPIVEA